MKITLETKNKIIEDLKNNLSVKDIMNNYNISRASIFRIKKEIIKNEQESNNEKSNIEKSNNEILLEMKQMQADYDALKLKMLKDYDKLVEIEERYAKANNIVLNRLKIK